MRQTVFIPIVAAFLISTSVFPASASEPPAATADPDFTWEKEIFVPMRDGVNLSTDVLLPKGVEGPFPTVLVRTPYHKDSVHWAYFGHIDRMFLQHGYAVVIQNERGRHFSEGNFDTYLAGARTDGYDAATWIVHQPWSNGRIGTFGCSSSAETQWPMASGNHPGHAAMLPLASGTAIGAVPGNHTRGSIYRGGVRMNGLWVWWYGDMGTSDRLLLPPDTTREQRIRLRENFVTQPRPYFYDTWNLSQGLVQLADMAPALSHLPTKDIMREIGRPMNPFDDVLTKGPADPYWDSVPLIGGEDHPKVPALHLNTWHDVGVGEMIRLYDHLEELGTPDQHLIIGAGPHCSMLSDDVMKDLSFGDLSLGDARYPGGDGRLLVDWFDRWLKGDETAAADLPKVQLFVMNRGWVSGDSWPLEDTRYETLYLDSDGRAGSSMGAGRLSSNKPGTDSPADHFLYDPANPVPSRGGGCCDDDMAVDQRDVEVRSDVLVYSTPPLEKGLTVVGPIRVVLHVSSTAKDTDFMVKLVDVHPDGTAINLYDDAFRVRYHEGFDREVFMTEGQVYEITLDNFVTANHFAPGHRLRIDVTSSNFPTYERNLNTGGNNFDETEWMTATNTVHHSSAHPSYVVLPILEG